MNKFFTLATFYLLLVTLFPPVWAQEQGAPGEAVRDAVRDKVKERIETLSVRPKAYVGTLASVTDSTLEIKTKEGKTLLASTSQDTTVIKVLGGKRSEIKFKDLALEDFVIAMGFVERKDVLSSKRIITLNEVPFKQKASIFGTVQENADGTLIIQNLKNNENWNIETNKKTVVLEKTGDGFGNVKLDKIEPGDKVVVAGTVHEKKEDTLLAGQILIVSKASQSLTR